MREPLDQHEKELPSIGPRTNSWAHAAAWSDCTVLSGLQNQKACEKEKIYGSDSAGPTKEPLGRSFTMHLPQYLWATKVLRQTVLASILPSTGSV